MPFLHTSLSLTLVVLYPRCGPRLRRRLSALLRPGTTLRFVPDRGTSLLLVLPAVVLYAWLGLCLTSRRLRALVLWLGGESQGQVRLRRAGSESRGAALSGCGSGWVVGSGRVLPSPGTGGNQGSAGSSTGGGLAGC